MTRLTVLLFPGTQPTARVQHLVARVATLVEGPVQAAFAERSWPTLSAALGRALDVGPVDEVIVVPMFLHAGYPATVDVPAVVAQARIEHGVPVHLTAPLGPDPGLVDALERAVPAGRAVVLVPDDTRDGAVRERLDRLARQWGESRGTPVAIGYPVSAPTRDTQVQRLASGRRKPVVVAFSVDTLAESAELAAVVAARYRSRIAVNV